MLKRLHLALLLVAGFGQPAWADGCNARDFLSLPLPADANDLVITALVTAYPDLRGDGPAILLPDGQKLLLGVDENANPKTRLANPSLREQFHDIYPLDFDLEARETPWFDPGRPRVEALFQGLYGNSAAAVAKHLKKTQIAGAANASFLMTDAQGVDCQMKAALADIAALKIDWAPAFTDVGGSFNWRKIAGTERFSSHSYGIAFDLNSALGGYWRWSGRPEGHAGQYINKIPMEIVQTFERYGFIWGGKWHHFDGMHFEYRPELILYARLIAR